MERTHEVLIFGPLCVEPALQKTGIGGQLMQATFQLAREAGHKAIIIFGEPGYYPTLRICALRRFRHHHRRRQEFRRLHGAQTRPRRAGGVHGKFHEAEIFENLPDEETDEFSKLFPPMETLRLPGRWGYEENTGSV